MLSAWRVASYTPPDVSIFSFNAQAALRWSRIFLRMRPRTKLRSFSSSGSGATERYRVAFARLDLDAPELGACQVVTGVVRRRKRPAVVQGHERLAIVPNALLVAVPTEQATTSKLDVARRRGIAQQVQMRERHHAE